MHPSIAEGLRKEVARTVHHGRLAGELGRARHEANDLHDPNDLVEVADDRAHGSDRIKGADLREFGGLLRADRRAHLPGSGQRAIDHGQLPRGVDEVAGTHCRNVGGERHRDLRHRQAKGSKPCLNVRTVTHRYSLGWSIGSVG